MKEKKYAVIVAGGIGSRMGISIPKQFLLLQGRPILFHTLERFYSAEDSIEIILVLPKDHIPHWEQLCRDNNFSVPHQIIVGGTSRFQSVKNGLSLLKGDGIVAIHDGVRPLLSTQLIQQLFVDASKNGNAVPCIQINDSMRKISGEKNEAIDRAQYRLIQTPQCFQLKNIKEAFAQEFKNEFTDEASVAESFGIKIYLSEGEKDNLKITSHLDLILAEDILKNKKISS